MQKLLLMLFAISLAGCAVFDEYSGEAAEGIASAIDEYCAQTDETFRAEFREKVNAETDHSIAIDCAY